MARDKPADTLAWLEARGTVLLGDRAVKVLNDLYTEAAWLGACVARAQVGDVRKAATLQVDWEGWKPGDIDAARLLVADLDSNGLRELQERSGFVMRGINETRMTDLSNALSNAVGQGLSQSATASLIKEKVGGASRWANVVANTETRRAVTAATLDTYAAAGIEMKEWSTAGNAVDECKDFEDDGPIPLDAMWGDVSGPPAHPNCLCVVVPVLGTATPVTPSEVVALPDDVEVVTEGESVPTVAPIVDENGFYDRAQWPVWAKESDLGDILDALPANRADIGFRRTSKAEAVLVWEQRAAQTTYPLPELEQRGVKAAKKLPKLLAQQLADPNRIGELADETLEAQNDIYAWERAQRLIAEAKGVNPDWESELIYKGLVDIDSVTGAPGKELLAQTKLIKDAGDVIEREAQSRLPESLRGKPEKFMTDEELAMVRQARIDVITEIRPMDTGEEVFNAMSDAEAKQKVTPGHGKASNGNDFIPMVKTSLDFYPSAWVDKMKASIPDVRVMRTERGYNGNAGRVIAISGQGEEAVSTFVHEIGHSMERTSNVLLRLQWAELFARSVKPTGKLPGLDNIYYGMSEKMFKGHRFGDRYTGKIYTTTKSQIYKITREVIPSGTHFEVFTTGMQSAFPRVKLDTTYGDDDGSFQKYILGLLVTL